MKDFLVNLLITNHFFDKPLKVIRAKVDEGNLQGDIDVITHKNDHKKACLSLLEALRKNNFKLISYRELDYMCSIILINNVNFSDESVKIDFFSGLGWYGVSKNDLDKKLFALDDQTASAVATIAHKLTYSGGINQKDNQHIGDIFSEGCKILNINDLIKDSYLRDYTINFFLKWRIRFRISGYKMKEIPKWVLIIFFKIFKSKIKPYKSRTMYINIFLSQKVYLNIKNELMNLYLSSGEKNLPYLTNLTKNNFFNLNDLTLMFSNFLIIKSHMLIQFNEIDISDVTRREFYESFRVDEEKTFDQILQEIIAYIDNLFFSTIKRSLNDTKKI